MNPSLPKIARIHLIYQFIIVTLVFINVVCLCYALLPNNQRTYIFYVMAPMLMSYAVIFGCCVQILPIPGWMKDEDNSDSERLWKSSEEDADVPDEACVRPVRRPSSLSGCGRKPMVNRVSVLRKDHRVSESTTWKNGYPPAVSATTSSLTRHSESSNPVDFQRHPDFSALRQWQTASSSDYIISSNSNAIAAANQDIPAPSRDNREESELERSYSFPFRQKRLTKWIEARNKNNGETDDVPTKQNVPYCQTVGYILAVKKEERERKRYASGPAGCSSKPQSEVPVRNLKSESTPPKRKTSDSRLPSVNGVKSRSGWSNFFSKLSNTDDGESKKRFSIFKNGKQTTKKSSDDTWYVPFERPDTYAGDLKDALETETEDSLEDHLSLFPEGMNKISKKIQDFKK